MTISDDKTTLNFVLDKGLKHKLQILADVDKRKLGSYVSKVLEQHISDFENQILETYGFDEFPKMYESIFGQEYPPYITVEEVMFDNTEEAIKVLNNFIRSSQNTTGFRMTRKQFNEYREKQHNKKEPSNDWSFFL